MELIQAAMRRSHSRDSGRSGRSGRSIEGTNAQHDNPPQGPDQENDGAYNYDDNYSAQGSDDYILPENYEQTRNDPIGKILLDMAHDQFMLAKKCKFQNMSTNIHEICENFEKFMELGEKQRQKHSEITKNEMEQRLINKRLSSHLINQTFRPPAFAKYPALTSVGKTADILKLFPHRNNKFSGHPKDGLSLLEFITSLNAAQEQAKLTEKEFKHMPYALFVNGNSALNIRSGTNMFNDKANAITKVIFGEAPYDKSLGPAVERQKGKAANGFDVSSCQFALHYMFKDNVVFYNFIRNVAECTKLNGYFIATCYDGKTIFNMLKKKQEGESIEIFKNDKKVWSITKDYKETSYENNYSCLGYQIRVFQDSINQTLPEYLVNYEFLI
jgi:hypothetical protein